MDFAEALAAADRTRTIRLRVDSIIDALEPDQAVKVRAALSDHTVGLGQIARALNAIGHPVSEAAIRTWRERNA